MPTSRQEAIERAIRRLNNREDDLVNEIERNIREMKGNRSLVTARGGEYTPQVVEKVAAIYRERGWHVSFDGYWMSLT